MWRWLNRRGERKKIEQVKHSSWRKKSAWQPEKGLERERNGDQGQIGFSKKGLTQKKVAIREVTQASQPIIIYKEGKSMALCRFQKGEKMGQIEREEGNTTGDQAVFALRTIRKSKLGKADLSSRKQRKYQLL